MRVCVLAYTYYEGDNRVRRYAEALVKRGDTVDVLACGQPGQPSRVKIAGVNVHRVQTRRIDEKGHLDYLFKIVFFLINSFLLLTWRHLRKPYQLIHVHSVPDFEVFAAMIAKWTGAKVILDIHDIVPEFYAVKFNAGKITYLARMLMVVEKVCCTFSDHVIISNHIWETKLVARSVEKGKCTVMLNYPDPNIFIRPPGVQPEGVFSMIYPGSLSRHQGLDIAIHALALVREDLGVFAFDIYGRGGELQALKDLTLSLGLHDRVFFHGILPLEEVAKKMAAAHLGIIPKRADDFGNEAFSTKIFEFMALGVPALVSSTKIDRFYFDDSVVMFFESENARDLADKILYLYKRKDHRDALSSAALKFIAPYSWEQKKSEYFTLADRLVNSKKEILHV